MKLKIRKIKEEKILSKNPIHLVNLKIFKNQEKNQIKKTEKRGKKIISFFLENIVNLQRLIYKTKNFPQTLNFFKKNTNKFSQFDKVLFFYNKKFFSWSKKNISKLCIFLRGIKFRKNSSSYINSSIQQVAKYFEKAQIKFNNNLKNNFKFCRDALRRVSVSRLIKFISIKNQYHAIALILRPKQINKKHQTIHLKQKQKKELFLPQKPITQFLPKIQIDFVKFRKIEIPFKTELFNKAKPLLIFTLIAFVFVLLLYSLFFSQKSQNSTKEVQKNIIELTNSVELSDFVANQSKLKQIADSLPANSKNRSLFKAENYLSSAGKYLVVALNNETKNETVIKQTINFQNNLLVALPKIQITNYYLTQVNSKTITQQDRNKFDQIKIYLSKLENNIQELLDYSKILLQILGNEKEQRYLIVFQDDNIIKPNGGVIENSFLIDINYGVIKKVETLLPSPSIPMELTESLNFINSDWQSQDIYDSFDFPTFAQKMIWSQQGLPIFKESKFKKIDGVISLNASLIPKILKITGPIKMSKYSTIVNSENFLTIKNQHDLLLNFIADFVSELLNKILFIQNSSEQSLKTLEILSEALSQKDVMFYFKDQNLQKDILQNNWGGEIKSINKEDYLAVVNTDINEKSEKNIEQSVNLQTQILDDGTIINTVKINRIYIKSSSFAKNLSNIKIYVPKGSVFLGIEGFKKIPVTLLNTSSKVYSKQTLIDEATNTRISQEFNKTTFSNWIEIESEKFATITFKYKLPFKLNDLRDNQEPQGFLQKNYKKIVKKFGFIDETLSYQLLVQKQSGKKDEVWKYSISLPLDWKLVWQNFPVDFIEKDRQIQFNSFLNQDQSWSMLLKAISF